MSTASQNLGKFAAELTFEDIPAAVVERAKDCIIDTIAAATFGAQFPWSQVAVNYARRYGEGGACSIIGSPKLRVHAPYAALANGVLAHAYEQDSIGGTVNRTGIGAHPGAMLVPAVLAACEETSASGKTAITAFVAGCEIMFRIGLASKHSPEKLGFHEPGLIGPYCAAVAAGRVLGLSADQLADAMGIAGSLSAGVLAFTKSDRGAMVKRLHLGRSSESGILAARFASEGYSGPESILEGKFGFAEVYCRDADPALLTADLGKTWQTLYICMKRYACHTNAHTSVQALRELMAQHGFQGKDVDNAVIEGSERLVSHHNILEPRDIMQAQYSVPFCIALALFRDPDDPRSFDASAVDDPAIRGMCRRVELRRHTQGGHLDSRSTRVTVRLKNGKEVVRDGELFKGMPDDPLTRSELRSKFMLLTAVNSDLDASKLFGRLENLEAERLFSLA